MAYTIVKSDGTVLTTIPDGTINTTSTSIGLPGRNYAGYGQAVDTGLVHILENFADSVPPPNPIRGQLWYNTNNSTLYVCPTDGQANALAWLALTATSSGGSTSFGNVVVTGDLQANNITANNNCNANAATFSYLTVTAAANLANANLTGTTTIANTTTTLITSGGSSTVGNITGVWVANGSGIANGVAGTSFYVTGGNLVIASTWGIRTDNYYYANGTPIPFGGSYSNANVAAYLPTYNGAFLANTITTPIITTGANTTPGTLTGNWTLTTGSRLQATYADLAERQHSDREYPIGTVVKVGGVNEITLVTKGDDSNVLGVVSNTAAYLMNADAGDDTTHPAIALIGRVKIRITGAIVKGDKISTTLNGCAEKASTSGFGWALETSANEGEKLILCIIK